VILRRTVVLLLAAASLVSAQDADNSARSIGAVLRTDPSDQSALCHVGQALCNTSQKDEIPALLKRLVVLPGETRKKEEAMAWHELMEPGQGPASDAKP
jgi:hypothetical protein